jgi:hypothetical protein
VNSEAPRSARALLRRPQAYRASRLFSEEDRDPILRTTEAELPTFSTALRKLVRSNNNPIGGEMHDDIPRWSNA